MSSPPKEACPRAAGTPTTEAPTPGSTASDPVRYGYRSQRRCQETSHVDGEAPRAQARPMPTNRCFRGLPLVLVVMLAGCVIDTAAPEEGPAGGDLGGTCESTDDCDGDLVCPAGGHLADHCAAECVHDDDCTVAVGDGYYCLAGVCTRVCRDTCSLGAIVSSCAANERCVSQRSIQQEANDCLSWCVP